MMIKYTIYIVIALIFYVILKMSMAKREQVQRVVYNIRSSIVKALAPAKTQELDYETWKNIFLR